MRPGNQTALPASQSTGLNRGRSARHLAGGIAQRGAAGGQRFGLPLGGGGSMPRGATASGGGWRKGGGRRAAFRSPSCGGRRMPRGVTASFAGADACKPWGRTLPPRRPPGGTGKGGKTPPVLGELAVSAPVPTRPLSLCGVRIPFRVSVCIRQQVQHGRRWRFPLC